jgi:ADP-heptose:LPS heptosyltransferase
MCLLKKLYNKISATILWRIRHVNQYLFKQKKEYLNSNTILIFRIDALGDYILFRNYIPLIVNNNKYKKYNFEFLGNLALKSLFDAFDAKYFTNSIWIDKEKFYNDIIYHYKVILLLKRRKYYHVINPIISHESIYNDYFIQFLSGEKLGFENDVTIESASNRPLSCKFDCLLQIDKNPKFEFFRNRELVEKIINCSLETIRLKIEIQKKIEDKIIIFPGAQDSFRRWSIDSFSKLITRITEISNFDIIIAGGKNDFFIAEAIKSSVNNKTQLYNYCGKTSLLELIYLINDSRLLISNETIAVHIGAAVNTKTICISNGNHYGRFNPYPKEYTNIFSIYPDEVVSMDEESRINYYYYGSAVNINTINYDRIFNKVKELL